MPIAKLFAGDDPLPASQIDLLDATNDVLRCEQTILTKSGEPIPVLMSATALQKASGGELHLRAICIAIDIRDRKQLELELNQAQKLESVGRLAAGVAHEINTPIQFVSDSMHFIREAVGDLAPVIQKYRALGALVAQDAGPRAIEAMAEVADAEERADVNYLLENVPKALDRSLEGLNRVAVIVRAMKEFAHPDQTEMTVVDLNRAIESTLVIARNEYKFVADVVTDFGEIPPLTCHGGDVNQVILNIVVNAAHAIADAVVGTMAKGQITVQTRLKGDTVVIRIGDTGRGIPEAVRSRIFDPFFTTKEVGKGTGQGLAIARAVIVEKHGGTLTFETEVGRGTTFVVRLPLNGKKRNTSQAAA
jgi:signal transduction histidine kinase